MTDESPLHLHSSWTGLGLAVVGGALCMLLAVGLLVSDGLSWLSGIFGVIALLVALVVLLDVPVSTAFSDEGITRRALLRHEFLDWDRVSRFERLRVGVLRTRRHRRGGGLVARVGNRRYVLVDRMEGQPEFDRLRRILGADRADALGLTKDGRPPVDHPPTWSDRRARWRPDGSSGR